jgi:hypothetical protein
MYSKCYREIYKLSSVTVKFRRIPEEILDKMVKYGIAETKSEAIRVAGGHAGRCSGFPGDTLVAVFLSALFRIAKHNDSQTEVMQWYGDEENC